MSEPLEQPQRQVVPRWRDFTDAVRLGELGSTRRQLAPHTSDESHLLAARDVWDRAINRGNETLAHLAAPDVLANALLLGKPELAVDVAQRVLSSDGDVSPTPLVGGLARRVTGAMLGHQRLELPVEAQIGQVRSAQARVRRLRHRLAANPHNPIGWVELARAYTITGVTERAIRAMTVALGHGGQNRFILRAAARLFVHVDQLDRAIAILSTPGIPKNDPWLLASELAISHLAGRPTGSMRAARRIADDASLSQFERSELQSAIATLELSSGKDKKARRLFNASLVDPHENSLAQAEWASEKAGHIRVPRSLFGTPDSYEARARDSAGRGDWNVALQQSLYWQHAEPFSVAAATHGSYVASVGLGDFEAGREIASQGLASNPRSAVLRNNLAYAEACLGNLYAATEQLRQMHSLIDSRRLYVPYFATSGLVAYRLGNVEGGRAQYRRAIECTKALPDGEQVQALVWAHFAQEELRARGDQGAEIVQQAQEAGRPWRRADIRLLLSRLDQFPRERDPRHGTDQRPGDPGLS